MKKRMISLIVVLIVTTGLLIGCTADLGSQDGYQHGNSGSNASRHNEDTDIRSGSGNGSHVNADSGTRGNGSYVNADSGTRGNGSRGNGSGQRGGAGNGICNSTETEKLATTSSTMQENSEAVVTEGYGASGAIADDDLTLEEMLTYAIQDENLAHAEYVYIIDTFSSARPFGNIIKAEEQHIAALLSLFTEYGMSWPDDTGSDHAVMVSGLTEAYQAGEAAEINNIAMYDTFLKQDVPDDVRAVFESLQRASENHLAAFRNHL